MEYSIQELSRLSGVTTRTLRWYDQIGLLKPSRVAESGYRYYGGAEVDRLCPLPAGRRAPLGKIRMKQAPGFSPGACHFCHLQSIMEVKDKQITTPSVLFIVQPFISFPPESRSHSSSPGPGFHPQTCWHHCTAPH